MSIDPSAPEPASTRRGVLLGVGVAGVAGALTACGGSGGDSGGSSKKPGGDALAKTDEIPVGGGKIFKDQKVVVTQPKKGEFEAFSAVCTHRGCTVGSVSGGKIVCPCHGSQYNVTNGEVVAGPAPKPLERKQVKVSGGEITLA